MGESKPKRRWFSPTPGWLVVVSLATTSLLYFSERIQWFSFNLHKGWTVLIAVAVVGVVLLLMLAWFGAALLLRRRFQFSLRSLLLLVVAAAMPCSWLAVEMKNAREQARAIENLGAIVYYDWQVNADGFDILNARPPNGAILRKLLGKDFFDQVVEVSLDAGSKLECLDKFPEIQWLFLLGTSSWPPSVISDASWQHIEGLSKLKRLGLDDIAISDDRLKKLQETLPNCMINRTFSSIPVCADFLSRPCWPGT